MNESVPEYIVYQEVTILVFLESINQRESLIVGCMQLARAVIWHCRGKNNIS